MLNYTNKMTKEAEGKETNNKTNIPATVYSMLITTHLELGEYEQARELINTLEKDNTPIDSSVYETFITTLGFFGGKGEGKSETMEEVTRVVERMKDKGLEPSMNAYKELLNNLINQRKTDNAVEVLEFLCATKKDLNVDLFTAPIREYCSNEEPKKALKVVELMKKVGVLPNEYLVTALIFCLVRTKQLTTAWDIVEWAKSAGLDIVRFGDIIQNAQKKSSKSK
jgi:pentatricopeptide repeat protein